MASGGKNALQRFPPSVLIMVIHCYIALSFYRLFSGILFLFTINQILSESSAMAIIDIILTIIVSGRLASTKKTIYMKDANINNMPKPYHI